MGKLVIKFLAVGAVASLVLWLWSASTANVASEQAGATVSVGQPGNTSDGQINSVTNSVSGRLVASGGVAEKNWSTTKPDASRSVLSAAQSADLEQRFATANELLASDDAQAAESMFRALIEDFPKFVEPYINLASLQAGQGDLEQARTTLLQAAEANQSTKVLFESINKLHGALAAQAYRNALETSVSNNDAINRLPKVQSLASDFAQAQKIVELSKLLAAEKDKQASLNISSAAFSEASEKLKVANSKIAALEIEQKAAIQTLQAELSLQRERGKVAAAELAKLQSDAAKAESDIVAKLRIELRNTESALMSVKDESKLLVAQNQDLSQQLAVVQQAATQQAEVASTSPEKSTPMAVDTALAVKTNLEARPTESKVDREAAIGLVEAWAKAWSNQDVGAYVNFYREGYSSSSNLSHQQWVAQREVRLRNKSFIQVAVSDFVVTPSSEGFSVTFTQHYRSNTLDDTITKRMWFTLRNGADWGDAKISGEQIIRS